MGCEAFANLIEDEGQALYHLEPRDKDPRNEEQRQRAFLALAKRRCPEVMVFAVPNAGKRSEWEIGKAKREGLRAGVCDLVCVWNRGVAFVEFKAGTTMPSAAQTEFLNGLVRRGQHCGVFRQEQSALDWLRSIGAPFVGRVF